MRLACFLVLVIIVASLCGCWTDDVTGTYVAGGNQVADLVQIVQGTDGHLTGRFAVIEMKPDGSIHEEGGVVDGAYRNRNIVITFHIIPIIRAITFSGTIRGNWLTMTATVENSTRTMVLLKSNEAYYQTLEASIKRNAQRLQAAKAEVEAERTRERKAQAEVARLSELTSRERSSSARTTKLPEGISKVKSKYRALTAQMEVELEHQKSIWGDGQAAVARAQVTVRINQLVIASNQLHIAVERGMRDIESDYKSIAQSAITAEAECAGHQLSASVSASCREFLEADREFWKQMDAERFGFTELEDFYLAEQRHQEEILHEAQYGARRM